MVTNEDRLIGPPGTGKTTFLSSVLDHHARRVGSDAVVAISHTRAAAAELAGRRTPIPQDNIATLHALAFRALDRPKLAADTEGLQAFSSAHPQWRMEASLDAEDATFNVGGSPGDVLLSDYSRRRNLLQPEDIWPGELRAFAKAWEQFKTDADMIDFTDMIALAARDTTSPNQDPAVIVLDEAQDTSRLQWQLLQRWASAPNCETLITAGDPDQSIYAFAGADPAWFTENKPARQKVLEQSYRVPIAVHKLAMGWIRQIKTRADVTYYPRDEPGKVSRSTATYKYPDPILPVIEKHLSAGKSVMVMASCSYMLSEFVSAFRRLALPFANPWRRKRGDWNPLYQRRGKSTVAAVNAFLAPHVEGRYWTGHEIELWMDLVKGVFRRGSRDTLRARISAMRTEDPDLLMSDLCEALSDMDDFGLMLTAPPVCIDWLQGHLLASKANAALYPLQVAKTRGVPTMAQEPRLYVGTCHSFKGAEADVVIICPDLSNQGYAQWLSQGRDEIVRLYYVALTRAREEVILCGAATGAAVWE
jgi:DNA helicase II / ATP-dependent DNA helicase PcrA